MVEDIVVWLLNRGALYLMQWVLPKKVLDLLCGRQNGDQIFFQINGILFL